METFRIATNDLRRGWVFAIVVKAVLFAFFAWQFAANWDASFITGGIAVKAGDTPTYYKPVEAFVEGRGYDSLCRMPGLLPVYAPLYALFGESTGKAIVVLLQWMLQVVSLMMLARLAGEVLRSVRVYYFVLLVYGLSTFVSVRDHYLLSDSFSISLSILAFWLLWCSVRSSSRAFLLASSALLTWAVFFRPVLLLSFPVAALFLLFVSGFRWRQTIVQTILYAVIPLVAIATWTGYTYARSGRFIPLQAPITECYSTFTPEHLAIRKLIIAMGEDFQPWSARSGAEWFFRTWSDPERSHPFEPSDFTKSYTYDSLVVLRADYHAFEAATTDSLRDVYSQRVFEKTDRYAAALRNQHASHYYFVNRLTLTRGFLFPERLDDLPFPAFSSMAWYHKAVKGGSLVLLLLVNAIGCIGIFLALLRRDWAVLALGLVPLSVILILGAVLGYVEQRYLAPAYPFMVLLTAYALFTFRKNWITGKTITER